MKGFPTLCSDELCQEVKGGKAGRDGFGEVSPQTFQGCGTDVLVKCCRDALRQILKIFRGLHRSIHLLFNALTKQGQ